MADKMLPAPEAEINRRLLTHIKGWLQFRDLTQRELARRLDLSEPTVSKWIKGTQSMTVSQFLSVASILEASPEELLFDPKDSPRAPRYRAAAEIAAALPNDQIDAWLAVGRAMAVGKK
jgi:transcriptional regulator with XRE-family HTH domain